MARVIVFDLNGTLLDLSVLDRQFSETFGSPDVRKRWFGQLTELFLTATIVDEYKNFDKLSDAALDMIARQQSMELSTEDRAKIHAASLALPAFVDVRPALDRLRAAGFRLVTLTNSTEKSARAKIKHVELDEYFEKVLSIDAIERYKPAAAAYEYAAEQLGVASAEIRMVAAHSWDIAGALNAGCNAAFIARPEQVLNPLGAKPDISASDLNDVAEQIIRHDT